MCRPVSPEVAHLHPMLSLRAASKLTSRGSNLTTSQPRQEQSQDALVFEEKGQYSFSSFDHGMIFLKNLIKDMLAPKGCPSANFAPPTSASISSDLAKLGVLPHFHSRVNTWGKTGLLVVLTGTAC